MTTTLTNAQPDGPFTADRLRQLILDNPPLPDPLNGATTLYVHPDRRKDAERINEAYAGSPGGRQLHIQTSHLASPKVIAGFKGDDCVLIIKTEKE